MIDTPASYHVVIQKGGWDLILNSVVQISSRLRQRCRFVYLREIEHLLGYAERASCSLPSVRGEEGVAGHPLRDRTGRREGVA
jgi:hypothetical protein